MLVLGAQLGVQQCMLWGGEHVQLLLIGGRDCVVAGFVFSQPCDWTDWQQTCVAQKWAAVTQGRISMGTRGPEVRPSCTGWCNAT